MDEPSTDAREIWRMAFDDPSEPLQDTEGLPQDGGDTSGPATLEAPHSLPDEAGPAGPRVLLVDDDATFRTATRRMLEDFGAEIVGEVRWGELGSTLSEAVEPDVVLMDYRMSGGNGIDATRSIKAARPDTQVLMMSGYDDDGIRAEAEEAGVFAYILKGSSPVVLRDRLWDAWDQRRMLTAEAEAGIEQASA